MSHRLIWPRLLVILSIVMATAMSRVQPSEASSYPNLSGPNLQYACADAGLLGTQCDDRVEGFADGNQLACPGSACVDEHLQIIWIQGNGEPLVIADRASQGAITAICPADGPYYFVLHWEQKVVMNYGNMEFQNRQKQAMLGCRLPSYEP
jgi:hypothetical protein